MQQEDTALLEAYAKIGEAKWREISKIIDSGRTDSMVSFFVAETASTS